MQELAAQTGRPAADLVANAIAGYLEYIAQTREMLDSRYDDIATGRVNPIDGEQAFTRLRQRARITARKNS